MLSAHVGGDWVEAPSMAALLDLAYGRDHGLRVHSCSTLVTGIQQVHVGCPSGDSFSVLDVLVVHGQPDEDDPAEDLRAMAREWHAVRDHAEITRDQLYARVREAVAGGVSESEAARIAGVDRMTVRKLLGK